MNLILQAIKSLLRKLENRISANIAELTPRVTMVEKAITTVRSIANKAKSTAQKALDAAGHAQTTADNAQTTADEAKEKADRAYTELNKKVSKDERECPLNLENLVNVQVGENYKVTYNGYMFSSTWSAGAMLLVRFTIKWWVTNASGGSSLKTYFADATLTASDSVDASGLLCWKYRDEDTRVFMVQMGNKANVSYVELVRLL